MQDKFLPPLAHKPSIENQQFKYSHSKALRYERFDSLKTQKINDKKVIIETDLKFMESIELLTKYQSSVLDEIIGLKAGKLSDNDCERIHFKAKRHSQANRLNLNSSLSKEDVLKDQSLKSLLCKCGCEKIKGDSYPICCDMEEMNILGSGVLLFFFVLKTMAVSLVIFICIFDLFAVITNLKGDDKFIQSQVCTSTYCSFRNNASDISKYMSYQMQIVQGWLGLAAMAVWIFASRVIKKIGHEKNQQIDKNLDSKSDYSIKISNLPYGQYSQEEILEYMLKLSDKIKSEKSNKNNELKASNQGEVSDLQLNTKKSSDGPMNGIFKTINENIHTLAVSNSITSIKSIQIIYNMEFSRKMIEKINNLTKQIKSLILKQNNKYIILKKEEYWSKKNDLIDVYELFEDLRKKFLNDARFRKSLSTRVTIIQFNQTEQKIEFLNKFGKENLSIYKQIKQKLLDKCFGNESQLIFKGNLPEIVRAPQPSDVIWQNCEKKQSIMRMVLIYLITFILILISLGIMVALEYGQSYFTKQSQSQLVLKNENISTILNIVVSLSLQIINAALWVSLELLLDLQYNHTFTNKIISQMNKSAVATWINIIILPIIVNYFINDRYYGSNGLSGIVFDYHISALTVGLVVKLLDPVNLLIKLAINIKCIRNGIINAKYRKTSDQSKISEESMKNVYLFYEAPQFNIAQFYNYILSNILHAVFFCSLQPFILILALLQVVFFYWICKFKIFKFCKIPKLTQKTIFQVALVQFTLVPIFYGVGSIYNSYVAYQLDNTRDFNFLGSAICIGLGLLSYFNPKNCVQVFVQCIMKPCSICFSSLNKKVSEQMVMKNIRMQNYFKNCNSLALLGFQNIIKGNTNSAEIERQLKDYCESHVVRYFQNKKSDPIKNEDQFIRKDDHQLQSSSQND